MSNNSDQRDSAAALMRRCAGELHGGLLLARLQTLQSTASCYTSEALHNDGESVGVADRKSNCYISVNRARLNSATSTPRDTASSNLVLGHADS